MALAVTQAPSIHSSDFLLLCAIPATMTLPFTVTTVKKTRGNNDRMCVYERVQGSMPTSLIFCYCNINCSNTIAIHIEISYIS